MNAHAFALAALVTFAAMPCLSQIDPVTEDALSLLAKIAEHSAPQFRRTLKTSTGPIPPLSKTRQTARMAAETEIGVIPSAAIKPLRLSYTALQKFENRIQNTFGRKNILTKGIESSNDPR